MLKTIAEWLFNRYEFTVIAKETYAALGLATYILDRQGRRIQLNKSAIFAQVGDKIKLKYDYILGVWE